MMSFFFKNLINLIFFNFKISVGEQKSARV
jgi:hypothetical protein